MPMVRFHFIGHFLLQGSAYRNPQLAEIKKIGPQFSEFISEMSRAEFVTENTFKPTYLTAKCAFTLRNYV